MNHLKLSDSPRAPGLVPDDTPIETCAPVFEPTTPPFDAQSRSDDEQEDEVEELLEHDLSSLKSADVKADPILVSLAKQQGRPGSQASKGSQGTVTAGPSAFRARPAPIRQENAGPRMTKSAALRQGLEWTDSTRARKAVEVPSAVKPREAPKAVSSLGNMKYIELMTGRVTCRTKSRSPSKSILNPPGRRSRRKYFAQKGLRGASVVEQGEREGGEGSKKEECRTACEPGCPIHCQSEFDHVTRSRTDDQAPRQNRSSALRTGGDMPPTSMRGLASASNVSQAKPGEPEIKPVLARRASIGVRSLGAPSIVSPLL